MAIHFTDEESLTYLVESGMASADELGRAMGIHAILNRNGSAVSLASILIEEGIITAEQWNQAEQELVMRKISHTSIGPYSFIKKLGEGSTGEVYLVTDSNTGLLFAMKLLSHKNAGNKEMLERFMREMRLTERLDHINITRVLSAGEWNGRLYYVMEWCEGESLDLMLVRERFLKIDDVLEIVTQVARGLSYAHERGIIHRDIKPSNIYFTQERIAKILDFGLCKSADKNQKFKTQTGMMVGTPLYMSPEQATGQAAIDARTDIYSLGATFYHLLTGWPPFDGENCFSIALKHVSCTLPNPHDLRTGIPDSIVCVIRSMMAKSPDDRYSDCNSLIVDLERIARGQKPLTKALEATKSNVALPSVQPIPPLYAQQYFSKSVGA
ncbi:MAG TPA: serine/threonine-protein kinase [Planctomycetota bacterium]|nr:serine/threonine-protein kinase [Planctomycetota bacterium]